MELMNCNVVRYVAAVASLLMFVGCDKEPVDDSYPVITPNITEMEVAEGGGSYSVDYASENVAEGMLFVVKSDVDWIVDIDTSLPNKFSFRVLCNDEAAPREATLTLRYPDAKTTPQIRIKQRGSDVEKLSLEITKLDYSECAAQIKPIDDTMPYVVMMAEKSYFAGSGITNADELVVADEIYFRALMAEGDRLADFLVKSNIELRGDTTKQWVDLSPAKEYVIYTYGISTADDSYRRITPIYHYIIPTRLPERGDVAFDVAVACDGPEVSLDVAPVAWDGYYMVQFVKDSDAGYIAEGEPFAEADELKLAESFFYVADHLYYFEELTADEVMQQLGHRGECHIDETLEANHRYMVLIYAIASADGNVPMMVSHPTVEYFTTGDVEMMDMTFEVSITNIRPRSVDISITPSADYPYTAVMMYAKNLPDGDKQEQLDYVMANYPPMELCGPYSEHVDQLPPATDFVLCIYGYYAGAPTTELYIYEFSTAEDGVGGNVISSVSCKAYDLNEVIALEDYYSSYAGYADYFLSVEVFTAESSTALHFDILPSYMVEEYGVDAIRESLLEYSYSSSPDWALCSYGNEYVVCGLAEDEAGYVGEIFISAPITFSYEDRGDAAEFVELYKEYTN